MYWGLRGAPPGIIKVNVMILSNNFELGKDFCFVGSEYPIQVGNRDFAIDLLFFHRGLNCLVAFELLCGIPHKSSYVTPAVMCC